jgi:peptide/nickel transport system substrate-binding protein
MRFVSSRLVAGAVTLCVVGAMAGCSNSSNSGSAKGAAGVATGNNVASGLTPDPNATFTYVGSSGSNPLQNPHSYGGGLSGWELYTDLYDRLVTLSPDGKSEQPMLASSWKWNSTNTQLTMDLRKDVMFQDGTPFNADVAVANLHAAQAKGSNGEAPLALMTSVVASGPYTLQLNFSSPDPDVIFALAFYPGFMVSMAGLAKPSSALASDPAGSGPYKLASISSALTFNLDHWDAYWNNKNHVYPAKYVELSIVNETTRFNAVQTGQANLAPISALTWNNAVSNKNLQSISYQNPSSYVLFMNNKMAPFNNPMVRQAVQMGIDRAALNASQSGLCTPVDQAIPQFLAGYDPSLKVPAYDQAQAKQLIQQAGATGAKVKILSITYPPYPTIAGIVQNNLDAIGLNASIDALPPGGTFRLLYQQGAASLLMAPTTITAPDASQILDTFVVGIGNPGTHDAALEAQIQQAEALPVGSSARASALQKVDDALTQPQDMLWVSLCAQHNLYVGDNKMIGLLTNYPNAQMSQAATEEYLQVGK